MAQPRRFRTLLTCLAVLSLAALPAATVMAEAPTRSVAVPEAMVRDRFLAYLFALIRYDLEVSISGQEFLDLFPEFSSDPESPVHFLEVLSRSHSGAGARVNLSFSRPIDLPAPVDVLGSHPIQLRSSTHLGLTESLYAPEATGERVPEGSVELAYLFHMTDGFLSVDLAPWLDFLLGSIIDDMDVEVIVIARYRQVWYGLMAGYNPDGEVVSGVFDLRRSRFLARPPRALTTFVRSALPEE